MKTFLFLILTALCAVGEARAMSARQHSVRGTVASVDVKRAGVTITSDDKDAPTEFIVVGKLTRLRRDQAMATLNDLTVGQPVQVHYSREAGKNVAYEISWKTTKTPRIAPP